MATTVYTDGACSGNPGPGGWAWAVPGGRFSAGAEPLTTNQRMELRAVLEAVTTLEGPLRIVSDSTYVVHCFRDRWWEGWLKRGWVNSAKKPVANRDLWEPLIDAYRKDPRRLAFEWVKGHSDDPMNDLVDRLAVEAARNQAAGTGDEPPDHLGPADVVIGAPGPGQATPDPRVPTGRRLLVVGHRPPELGGYEDNPVSDRVRAELAAVLSGKRVVHPDLVVLTGLGLGAEQLGAEAALQAGVPYTAVLPFPDPDAVWPAASKARYRALAASAQSTVLLQTRAPATKQQAGAALSRRDAWLYRHADEAIAVWDGSDPVVGKVVRSLHDHLGEEEVWLVHPGSTLFG